MILTQKSFSTKWSNYVIVLLCSFFVWTSAFGSETQPPGKITDASILLLNSYHPGFYWSDGEQAAIVNELQNKGLIKLPIIEYLDYKRLLRGEHLAELQALFRKKYQGKRLSVLIALDGPALNFAIKHHRDIFGNVPLVFCGVSDFKSSMLAGDTRATGVVDTSDPAGTIELMLRLHPKTREIFVLHDYSIAGLATRKDVETVLPRFTDRVRFRFNENLAVEEIFRKLERLPKDCLVFLLIYANDKTGKNFDTKKLARLFSRHSTVPMYDRSEVRLGYGIVGGKLLSPAAVGAETAKLVTRILQGENVGGIPVVFKNLSQYMFDYEQLKRFTISESSLPPDSIIINRPLSLFAVYKGVMVANFAVIGLLLLGICFLIVVIFQRRRIARKLKESEAKYYDLYENAPDMYYSLDVKTGSILECNKAFLKGTGYTREEVIGHQIFEFYDGDTAAKAKRSFQKFPETGEVQNVERKIKRKDGSIMDVSLNVSAVRDKAGNMLYSRSIWRDITRRKQSADALLAAEKRFRVLLENIHQVAVMLDGDGNIIFCNDYLLELTGWSRDEILHKNYFEIFIPEPIRKDVQSILTACVSETDMPVHYENQILTRAGAQRLIVWNNTPLRDSSGRISGLAGIGVDVTEHRKLEEQLLQSQKMEAVGTLAGGVAHDFNNILTAILGYANLIQLHAKENAQLALLALRIVDSVDRASELTKNLLAFSRKQAVDMKPLNLNEIINSFRTILSRIIGEDIEVAVRLSTGKLVVEADRGQLEQVLMNLAANARDAMPRGGKLFITTEEGTIGSEGIVRSKILPGKYAILAVSDNGMGIDKQIQEHIFEPFFTTKEVGRGTGLGLSMVYGIIEKHNGFIDVYSELGKGATFKIYLPLIDAEVWEVQEVGDDILSRGNEIILLTEDDEAVRNMMAMLLKKFGYRVLEAGDGKEALSIFRDHQDEIQLIVTDVIMPEMNGLEMYNEVRRIKPDMPAIFMSGYTADIIGGNIFREDNVYFLSKPLKATELLHKIREIFQ
ncbi:MAG: PAS domain S-box protein [Deltaproteobacteria bacterium]|nr:PAS domain S-box protein [Deltaproteobacteria bacterium]